MQKLLATVHVNHLKVACPHFLHLLSAQTRETIGLHIQQQKQEQNISSRKH